MFGLLNTTQIYGIQTHQQEHEQKYEIAYQTTTKISSAFASPSNTTKHHCRSQSSVSDTGSIPNQTKSPTNFLEKLLRTDLLNTYDTLKNYRSNSSSSSLSSSHPRHNKRHSDPLQQQHHHHHSPHQEGILNSFNCLQGSYRHSFDGEFYEKVQINSKSNSNSKFHIPKPESSSDMTIKCSKNLLAIEPEVQGPATLQNYQKIPESEHDMLVDSLVASSGASSGEFNSSSDATTNTQSSSNSGSGGGGGVTSSFSSSSSNLYKRLSFGGRSSQNSQKQEKNLDNGQAQQQHQQNGIPPNSVAHSLTSALMPSLKVIDLHRSSSSTSSSGDFLSKRDRKKGAMTPQPEKTPLAQLLSLSSSATTKVLSPPPQTSMSSTSTTTTAISSTPLTASNEKAKRRKLLKILAAYEQQNKLLQRELAKEKSRRSDELSCVVKSLLCFESKLKSDMKSVNHRLQEKDNEICRLVRQNRTLRKMLRQLQKEASECARDEGVVEDDEAENEVNEMDLHDVDCLQLEALQCINCQRQFYDIEVQENYTQTTMTIGWDGLSGEVTGGLGGVGGGRPSGLGGNASICLKDASGGRINDTPTTEHGSSSDDTVSSSFFGARRSVRYTSKRTSGTFRDYMRSRAMNIDDPSLEADDNNSEEYPSTISHDDSSHEKLNIYSRTIERMHGVKCESERDSEQSGLDTSSSSWVTRSNSRASTKSSKSSTSSKASEMSCNAMEEDDGIFSPTQDEDFDDEGEGEQAKLKIVRGRALEAFSEASPKQIYETSTDDWYASASDQEEISSGTVVSSKSYGQGAINPVLECVNQILLQQSMEGIDDRSQTPKSSTNTLPRRSSLSDRRNNRNNSCASDGADPNSRNGTLTRKRVHFSTKNSMVHVPRNDETEEEDEEDDEESNIKAQRNMISSYQGMVSYIGHTPSSNIDKSKEAEHLEVLNYESIYSNEYEPIGSELNSSNLYVDMEAAVKPLNQNGSVGGGGVGKQNKLPPALPPKPANLLKFKKSLHQLEESPDELMEAQNCEALVEPDYCSISEVNVGITSVQIRADIHRAPLSERDLESVVENDNDLDAATVVSEALSQKTEEIEEIFADIPKLPNVAAIIAPKSSLKQNDYLTMAPKSDNNNKVEVGLKALVHNGGSSSARTMSSLTKPDRSALKLNLSSVNSLISTPMKSPKLEMAVRPAILHCSANYQQQQYKRKHMPNILQEINKRLSLPNSPITSTPPTMCGGRLGNGGYNKSLSSINDNESSPMQSLPLQAEFDWYNLDAEYGKNSQNELSKVCDILGNGMPSILADIKEDGESLINTADEYNLDEEYKIEMDEEEHNAMLCSERFMMDSSGSMICEAINPSVKIGQQQQVKAKKIKKNLANFEKFIENTGSSNKPLPSKRKIYFTGPFV